MITREEALIVLKFAPNGGKPSCINRALTQAEAVEIIRKAVESYQPGQTLNESMTKLVFQVCQNKKRPAYCA